MSKRKKQFSAVPVQSGSLERRRKAVENTAAFGLILLAVGLMAPFGAMYAAWVLPTAKWIFAAGALVYTVARVVNVSDPSESARLRRLRRMEAWAGFAFCIAAGFWFYKDAHIGAFAGPLALLRDTILFSLVGAVIQIISAWLISSQIRKENRRQGQ